MKYQNIICKFFLLGNFVINQKLFAIDPQINPAPKIIEIPIVLDLMGVPAKTNAKILASPGFPNSIITSIANNLKARMSKDGREILDIDLLYLDIGIIGDSKIIVVRDESPISQTKQIRVFISSLDQTIAAGKPTLLIDKGSLTEEESLKLAMEFYLGELQQILNANSEGIPVSWPIQENEEDEVSEYLEKKCDEMINTMNCLFYLDNDKVQFFTPKCKNLINDPKYPLYADKEIISFFKVDSDYYTTDLRFTAENNANNSNTKVREILINIPRKRSHLFEENIKKKYFYPFLEKFALQTTNDKNFFVNLEKKGLCGFQSDAQNGFSMTLACNKIQAEEVFEELRTYFRIPKKKNKIVAKKSSGIFARVEKLPPEYQDKAAMMITIKQNKKEPMIIQLNEQLIDQFGFDLDSTQNNEKDNDVMDVDQDKKNNNQIELKNPQSSTEDTQQQRIEEDKMQSEDSKKEKQEEQKPSIITFGQNSMDLDVNNPRRIKEDVDQKEKVKKRKSQRLQQDEADREKRNEKMVRGQNNMDIDLDKLRGIESKENNEMQTKKPDNSDQRRVRRSSALVDEQNNG